MSPADEESRRLPPCGPRRRKLVPEAPSERIPPEGGFASAFEDAGYRSVDDGIGESPASQFEGDFEAPGAAAEHELLRPTLGERGIVDVPARGGGRQRRVDDLLREACGHEMACDLGARARGTRQVRDGGGERRDRRILRGCEEARSGRS